jgi:uncharacterized protein YggE
VFWAAAAAAMLSATAARAQYDPTAQLAMQAAGKPAVHGAGAVVVQREPTRLRMFVQVSAKGKNLEDALAKMKDRREATTTVLERLKVDKESIVFSPPSLSNPETARKQQMEAMIRAQMRQQGKKVPAGLQLPKTVTLSAMLTAEWPLEAKSTEQRLLMAQALQEKIKAADLTGRKEAQELSPEEEELAEEANRMVNERFGEQQAQQDQAQFVFVARLSKEDRKKAMADAFAKAKANAAELAAAAGTELGPLVGLSGSCSGQSNFGENEYNQYSPGSRWRQIAAQQAGDDSGAKQDEAFSNEPDKLSFGCSVTASFALGK